MSAAANRRRGHDCERAVAAYLRANGFPDACTTRAKLGHDGATAPGDIWMPVLWSSLHVHHKAGRRLPDANRLDRLAALCPPCHAHVHAHPAESYTDGWLIHWENAS